VSGIDSQVGVISSQLSSTNQNNIALSLQNFQTSLNQLANSLTALENQVNTSSGTATFTATTSVELIDSVTSTHYRLQIANGVLQQTAL